MAANTSPIFSLTPNITANITGTATTKSDGAGTVGTDMIKVYTAGSAGAYITRIRLTPISSVQNTNTAATIVRLYVSTIGSGSTTSANTWLIKEFQLPITSAASSTVANIPVEEALNFAMAPTTYLHVSTHIANATNTSWQCVVFGGDY